MKLLLLAITFISGITFAQTNIIAAKSHASSQLIDKNDTDNFGDPGPMRFIESVKYLKDDCIVEKYHVEWSDHDTEYDTVCDHPFLKENTIDIDRIKAMYPAETKFIDFDNIGKKSKRELRKEKRSENSNGMIFLLIGGGLFLIYLFTPRIIPSKS